MSYTGNADTFADPPSPTVLTVRAADLVAQQDELFRECFGPTVLVASYHTEDELLTVARMIDGQLTATIIGEDVTVGHAAILHAAIIGDRVLVGMGAVSTTTIAGVLAVLLLFVLARVFRVFGRPAQAALLALAVRRRQPVDGRQEVEEGAAQPDLGRLDRWQRTLAA